MITVEIEKDEWYPVYSVSRLAAPKGYYSLQAQVSDEQFAEWQDIQNRFDRMQKELAELFEQT